MTEDAKTERKPIFGNVYGTVVPGSLKETDKAVEARIQSGPNAEYARPVKVYKNNGKDELVEAFKQAAADSSKKILVEGTILGSKARDSVHLAVNRVNSPRVIEGKVSNVRHSAPEKQPFVSGFIVVKGQRADGTNYSFGRPFHAFNEAAESLAGLQAGDTVQGGARESRRQNQKDGNVVYEPVFEFIGAAGINGKGLTAEKADPQAPAASSPETKELESDAFPDNNGWDDDIPF